MSDKLYTPSNPNAQQGVRNVLKYLSDITYEKIITGQHTQTMAQEELHLIEKVTGKQPALLGFELLSYSPNINYSDTDDECMTEVTENYGTLKRAWEWAEKKGLITMCWHWFSPLHGRSKSFFSENTDFDASKAVIDGTPENKALLSDMDTMAGILRPFCEKECRFCGDLFTRATVIGSGGAKKERIPLKSCSALCTTDTQTYFILTILYGCGTRRFPNVIRAMM